MKTRHIFNEFQFAKLGDRKIFVITLTAMLLVGSIVLSININQPTKPITKHNTSYDNTEKRQSVLAGRALYVDPAIAQSGIPTQIADQPLSLWLGDWTKDIRSESDSIVTQSTASNKIATLVAYDIPNRDCGSHSIGGAKSSNDYRQWIDGLVAGIGKRQVIVVVEPDALAQIDCLHPNDQAVRYADISYAVTNLATNTNAYIYIDAGNSGWKDADDMAAHLQKADIGKATGFSLNVSNFLSTASNTAYGDKIAEKVKKSFIIDTGRNGNGTNGEWCNPRGRALGTLPRTDTAGNVDAYLWIKRPGQSDGTCNGGPAAGTWWPEYAQQLIANAGK